MNFTLNNQLEVKQKKGAKNKILVKQETYYFLVKFSEETFVRNINLQKAKYFSW